MLLQSNKNFPAVERVALADVLSDQDAGIFCLGAYTGAVPDEELRRITVDYTVEFARVRGRGGTSRRQLQAPAALRIEVFLIRSSG